MGAGVGRLVLAAVEPAKDGAWVLEESQFTDKKVSRRNTLRYHIKALLFNGSSRLELLSVGSYCVRGPCWGAWVLKGSQLTNKKVRPFNVHWS